MGSFCGADGYGVIHPSTINAMVLQCCIASSSHSESAYKFDAMALVPTMDLMMSCKTAEAVAQTIVQWNQGEKKTESLDMIRPPGAEGDPASLISDTWHINAQQEIQMLLGGEPFRQWTGGFRYYDADDRLQGRQRVAEKLSAGLFISLTRHMASMATHTGAHLRAYHFIRHQSVLGLRGSEAITLQEVKEMVEKVVEWKWVSSAPFTDYEKYFSGAGGLGMVVHDFRGRKKLKALWDVT